jgi:hypothetical protein
MKNLHPLKNIKMNKNEKAKRLMIEDISELQEATRSEVVVGVVGIMAFEFLVTAPFATYVTIQ